MYDIPEAATFYETLGDTKLAGEMHNAVGDIYMDYMDIPESVVPDKQFAPLETAYYNYVANPDIKNAAAFLGEASKIYVMPGVTQHTFDPNATMNTAMDADFNARVNGMLDEAYAAGKSGMPAGEFAQSKGIPETLTDADADGTMMKMDGNGSWRYNGGKGNAEGSVKVVRPSWRQSEMDAAKDFFEYKPQVSYKKMSDGTTQQVPYGTKGSVRPDYFKSGYSIDIKNYNVTTQNGRRNLIRNIEKQYYQRIENLPTQTKQTVVIDIRGQNVTGEILEFLYSNILGRTSNGIEIIFKTH